MGSGGNGEVVLNFEDSQMVIGPTLMTDRLTGPGRGKMGRVPQASVRPTVHRATNVRTDQGRENFEIVVEDILDSK